MLNALQQSHAATRLARQLTALPAIQKARHIGMYLAADGEISLDAFYKAQHKSTDFYAPKILKNPKKPMRFNHISGRNGWFTNHFGIKEVSRGTTRDIRQLDIILMPLVAFDHQGNRLGMGGGFYDKSLAFKHQGVFKKRPFLIGVAHSFQQVNQVPADSWDIALDMIVTDKAVFRVGFV